MFNCTNAILVFCLMLFIWEIWRYGHHSPGPIITLNVSMLRWFQQVKKRREENVNTLLAVKVAVTNILSVLAT